MNPLSRNLLNHGSISFRSPSRKIGLFIRYSSILALLIFTFFLSVDSSVAQSSTASSTLSAEGVSGKSGSDNKEDGSNKTVTLPEMVVVDSTESDGSEASGYRMDEIQNLGPWGEKSIQDTPFSISVMPSDLIENVQATSPEELFKYNPYAHVYISSSRFADNINMRGFYNNLRLVDGMRIFGTGQTLEDKESVEIMTGLTGFLYGLSNPAGSVNYVTKRPTSTQSASMTLRSTGKDLYAHADISRPVGNGDKFSYRINIAGQDGETFIDEQEVHKYLASGALDWRMSDSVKMEFDASTYYKKSEGMQIPFASSTGKNSDLDPDDLDTSKLWGQKWGYQMDEYSQAGAKLTWDLNKSVSFRTAMRYSLSSSERLNVNAYNIYDFFGTYNERIYHISPMDYENLTGYAYVDSRFSTGFISHLLTVGMSADRSDVEASPDRTASLDIDGEFSFSNPIYVDKPHYTVGSEAKKDYSKSTYNTITIGDEVSFNREWSLLVGTSYCSLDQTSYNLTTGEGTDYDKGKFTPSLSLLYKPVPLLTTYVSYIEGLAKGGTAPDSYNGADVLNAGEIMEPVVSKQKELGAKMTLGKMLLTAALFDIDNAYEYVDPDSLVYVQDGNESHKGVELTATGRIIQQLTVTGGLTFLDAEVEDNAVDTSIEGNRPAGVPNRLAKLYAEYDLPWIKGLTFTGGIFHTGDFMNDADNTDSLSSVTTYDLGCRYRMNLDSHEMIVRFNICNLTDERYWMSYGYIGDPRYCVASVTMNF